MSRVAQLDIMFSANLAAAKAAYDAFKQMVQNTPLIIPFQWGPGGGPNPGGGPGPGGNPGGPVTYNIVNNYITNNGGPGPNPNPNPNPNPSPGPGGNPFWRRLARGGGLFLALHGINELDRQFRRERDVDETERYEGQEAASVERAAQTREDRGQNFIFRGIRNFVAQSSVGRFFGAQTDDEHAEQDRQSKFLLESGRAQDRFRIQNLQIERSRETLNEDPLTRQQSEAGFRLRDARDEADAQRSRGKFIGQFAPDAGAALRKAADGFQKEAERFYLEETKRFEKLREHQVDLVSQSADVLDLDLARRPFDATLQNIKNDTANKLFALRDTGAINDPLRAQISREGDARLKFATQEEDDARKRIGLELDTHAAQTAALLDRDPTSAKVAGIVGQGIGRFTDLVNSQRGDLARQSIGNSIGDLNLTKQQYLDQFRGQSLGNFTDVSNARDNENPSTVLQHINDGIDKLNKTLESLGSD